MIITRFGIPKIAGKKENKAQSRMKLPQLEHNTHDIVEISNKKRKSVSFGTSRLDNFDIDPEILGKIFIAADKVDNYDSRELRNNILNKLIGKITNNDPDRRVDAIEALDKIGVATSDQRLKRNISDILTTSGIGIHDINPDVRKFSAEALGKIGAAMSDEQLKRNISEALAAENRGIYDNNRDVIKTSAEALGKIGAATSNERLQSYIYHVLVVQCINDSNEDVRKSSAEALGKVGAATSDQRLQSYIYEALKFKYLSFNDGSNNVKKASIEALGKIGAASDNKALRVLNTLIAPDEGINYNSVEIQIAVLQALKNIASNKGSLNTGEYILNPDGTRLLTANQNPLLKTLCRKVLDIINEKENSTREPNIYAEAVICRKELEKNSPFLYGQYSSS